MAKSERRYWLLKSEADCYSIDDLKRDKRTFWDGVRNYQARNFMRDQMKVGDLVLFHHSNAEPPGVAGLARICKEAYVDHTQFEKGHEHFDAKSKPENPAWLMVDVEFVSKFERVVPMAELRAEAALARMALLQKGQRLSVQPVSESEFRVVCGMAGVSVPGA